MMSRSKAVAVLFYCSAMLIGAAAGIAIDRNYVHGKVDEMRNDPRAQRDGFFTFVGFTDAQRASWDSVFDARRRADSILIAPIRAQERLLRPQRDSLREATKASLRALLTADQQKLLDEWQAKEQAARAKEQEERRQRSNDGRR
jgi:hypothetical protein